MTNANRAISRAAMFVGLGGSLLAACGNSDGGGSGSGQGGTIGAAGVTGAAGTTGGTGTTGVGGTTGPGGTTGVGASAGVAGTTGVGATAGAAGTTGAAGANGAAGTGGVTGSGGAAGVGDGAAGSAGVGGSTGGGGVDGGGASGSAPSAGCGKPAGLMSGRASIDVSGKTREYIIALPSNYDQNKPYRLIFGWHPWGGSAQQVASGRYYGLSSVINGQAILVAPEGQPFQNGGLGWGNANGEDIAFLHAMLDRFGSQLCIDQNRIFSTGFSFGAMFSFTLACTEMSMMRAIAPMAGNAMTSGRCENGTRSVATLAFIGVDDTLLSGHRQAVQIFVERNGCSTQTMTMQPSWCDGLSSNNQPCTCVEYQGCKAGYPVISCEFKGGHTPAPNAGATLWNFFTQF